MPTTESTESSQHEFTPRTRSPVSPCKWCGRQFSHAVHTKEEPEEVWETKARRDIGGEKEWRR